MRRFGASCAKSATLPIFADDDTKAYASSAVASLAGSAQLQHTVAQWIAHDDRWRRRRNSDGRSGGRWGAELRRDHNPGPVGSLLIASALIIAVPTRPGLALRGYNGAGGAADDGADRGAFTSTRYSADHRAGRSTE